MKSILFGLVLAIVCYCQT